MESDLKQYAIKYARLIWFASMKTCMAGLMLQPYVKYNEESPS
jgi:plasmid rolling circle replication initiator protein Rep